MTKPSFDTTEMRDEARAARRPWSTPQLEVADVSAVTEAKDPYSQEQNVFNQGPPS
ncbi:hypothetical protein [Caulobacter sp. FWC2]|uniref:hypothetical protein n=1 Tax=Caulobacter sp. FWC2 TaxID=69664 RepID=UPI001304190D|nr:hypothetical protein [Caulobacter sp. FWC2]